MGGKRSPGDARSPEPASHSRSPCYEPSFPFHAGPSRRLSRCDQCFPFLLKQGCEAYTVWLTNKTVNTGLEVRSH